MSKPADLQPGRCFAYIRVSKGDQVDNGKSLAEQEERLLRTWSERYKDEGYTPYRLFREEGESAYRLPMARRTQGAVMLSQVRPGDMVMFSKMDRAFRNVDDGRQVMSFLRDRRCRVFMLDYLGKGEVDSSTPMGQFVYTLALSLAEFESANKGERIRRVFEHLTKTRGWNSRPPPGYRTTKQGGKVVAIVDVVMVREAELLLVSHCREGWQAGLQLFKDKRISLSTWTATGSPKPRRARCAIDPRAPYYADSFKKALNALWATGKLAEVVARHQLDLSNVFDPEGQRCCPYGTRWLKIPLRKMENGEREKLSQ